TYSFPILSLPEVHRIVLSLPADLIRNSRFQIKFIRAINPEYLDGLDVFSHRRLFKISNSGKEGQTFFRKKYGRFCIPKSSIYLCSFEIVI
ncbi:MAG: hypothetical protein V8T44_01830, partial [Odoribacter splanchnicus]